MAVISPEKTYDSKAIRIQNASMLNFKGDDIDITNFLIGFTIFEDIRKNTMSMQVGISDGVGLIERFPIVGDEIVVIQFTAPSYEESITVAMPVYAIYDKQKLNDTTVSYVLDCVSFEYLNSLSKTADKAYTGLAVSDMVKDVYQTYLQNDTLKKELFVDDSIGNHNFIAPETDPLEFITFLAHEAVAGNESANYMFYEDHEKFNFRTLNRLYRQEPVYQFVLTNDNVDKKLSLNGTQLEQSNYIEGFTVVREMDVLTLTEQGYYDNSVLAIDPVLKRFRVNAFNYNDNFDLIDHLADNKSTPVNSRKSIFNGASRSKYFVSSITDGNYYQEPYLEEKITAESDVTSFYPSRRWLTENKRMAITSGMEYLVLDVDVPGNPIIKAGDIVDIFIPADTVEEELAGSFNTKYGDEFGLAKFLVQRVCHRWNRDSNEYITSMRVTKDTTATEILPESEA